MARPEITDWSGALFQRQLRAVLDYLESNMVVAAAENAILKTDGVTVSVGPWHWMFPP